MIPNAFVIGAPKCATTSLCDLLDEHPDVFVCPRKEVAYFSHDRIYAKGWDWYREQFAGHAGERVVVDGSTAYSMTQRYPRCVDRLAKALPDARLVYIVRHPVEQVRSWWVQTRVNDDGDPFTDDFNADLRREPTWFVDQARYLTQVSAYERRFPPGRMEVLFFEDFARDPTTAARRCFEHFSVDPNALVAPIDAHRHLNATDSRRERSDVAIRLKHTPGYHAVKRLVPRRLRGWARWRCLTVRPRGKPSFDAATLRWLVGELRDDAAGFLERFDKPDDFWDLSERYVERTLASQTQHAQRVSR